MHLCLFHKDPTIRGAGFCASSPKFNFKLALGFRPKYSMFFNNSQKSSIKRGAWLSGNVANEIQNFPCSLLQENIEVGLASRNVNLALSSS